MNLRGDQTIIALVLSRVMSHCLETSAQLQKSGSISEDGEGEVRSGGQLYSGAECLNCFCGQA